MISQNQSNVVIETLKLKDISDNVLRFDFYSQSHIEELMESIKNNGLHETLLVHRNNINGKLTLLNGHYRIRALKRLGLSEVACRLILGSEEDATTHYLASFIKKNSTTSLEEGHIILELVEKGYPLEKVSRLWGKSPSWACRRVKLIKSLESEIKEKIKSGGLSPRIAQELTRLPQGNEQKKVYQIVTENRLTKDETSKLVDRWLNSDEKEKMQIEKDFSTKMPMVHRNMNISSPEIMIKSSLTNCYKATCSLINCMEYIKDYKTVWPWAEYENLLKQINHVASLISGASDKGVQNES